jgi:6,7-dimethyl-8-ribityllumazine synthase
VTEESRDAWPDRSAENLLAPEPPPPGETPPESEPEPTPEPELAPEPDPPAPERAPEREAKARRPRAARRAPEPKDGAAPQLEAVPLPEPEPAEAEPEPAPEPAPPGAETAAVAEHAGGELVVPEDVDLLEGEAGPTKRLVALVVGRFNGEITTRLLASALAELDALGLARAQVTVVPVPGAFELPLAAMALAKTRRYICVVALGCVIRGETPHFDYVASEAASGLQLAGLETGVPVAFGVLTCDTVEQAEARVGKGADAVRAALEMADLFSQLRQTAAAG